MSNLPSSLTPDPFKEWILKQEVEPISFTIIIAKRDPKARRSSPVSGTVFVQYRNIEREFDNANNTVFLSSVAKQLWQQMSKFKANYLQNRAAPSPALVFPNTLSP